MKGKEIWRDIHGYEGLYKISNWERVWSCYVNRVMRTRPDKDGYRKIGLTKRGVSTTYLVHRLVAQAFIPNPYNLPCINHKDEIKTHNTPDNLEWCTQAYNNGYGSRRKRPQKLNREKKPIGYKCICVETGVVYQTINEAGRLTGLCSRSIARCCKGERITTGGFHWEYYTEERGD